MMDMKWQLLTIPSLIYLLDRQGEGRDTGLFEWKDIIISNVTGTSNQNRVVLLDCAKSTPCHDIRFENFNVKPGKTDPENINFVCNNVVLGGEAVSETSSFT